MKPILEVKNLSKQFLINSKQEKYLSLRDSISGFFKRKIKQDYEILNALDDLSFDVFPGESIGIIGRNGAGKSTLLKILSKITPPTSGKIICRGRIASLLEVGTGFHPELTGRENIYMNGSILGMRKWEIDKNFDEIVDFSGVERFLDTQLKHYSSGMQLRLAFAVAAHLEPEILIIDEVLAVGDAEFQKRCLGKMDEVSKSGRTVLFVSHQIGTIAQLCDKSILLDRGRLVNMGNTEKMISQYLTMNNKLTGEIIVDKTNISKNKKLLVTKIRLLDENNNVSNEFDTKKKLFVEVFVEVFISGIDYTVRLEMSSSQYGVLFTSSSIDLDFLNQKGKVWQKGFYSFKVELPVNILKGGDYYLYIASTIPNVENLDASPEISFRLIDVTSVDSVYEGRAGSILQTLEWKLTNFISS